MNRIHIRLSTLLAMMVMVASGLVINAAAAQAYPSNCDKFYSPGDSRSYARCRTGTGMYRVGMPCKYKIGNAWIGYAFEENGAWAPSGNTYASVAACPFGSLPWTEPGGGTIYPWIDVRN